MRTSQRIKDSQKNPPRIVDHVVQGNRHTWKIESESHPDRPHVVKYTVGNPRSWTCTCPHSGACRHIEAAVLDLVRLQNFKRAKAGKAARSVSFWTAEADALAQKRGKDGTLEFSRGRHPFWVTVRRAA